MIFNDLLPGRRGAMRILCEYSRVNQHVMLQCSNAASCADCHQPRLVRRAGRVLLKQGKCFTHHLGHKSQLHMRGTAHEAVIGAGQRRG